jgi:ketosteroid isomerase-like protein
VRLEWGPAIAGIAASGDFGFTSGPSTMSMRDGSLPARHGAYFSVWTRGADGRWKVAIDGGVRSTAPIAEAAMQPAPEVRPAQGRMPDTIETLLVRERSASWDRARWRAALAGDALLLANDTPIVRGPPIADALAAAPVALEPLGGRMATSADLAYTYGRFSAEGAQRHYVHLWTRGGAGEWRIGLVLLP